MSELYFDYLPEELNTEILKYIDTYESFINLNTFNYFNSFDKILSTNTFWKNLFRISIGDLIEYININFKVMNIYYMAMSYIKAITSLRECRNLLNQLKNIINSHIQEYYPNKTMETIDVDLIEGDTYEILERKKLYILIV